MNFNEYSQSVYKTIIQRLPILQSFCSCTDTGHLIVEYPHPKIPTSLHITTLGDEITLGFEQWHTHGDILGGPDKNSQIITSLNLIEEILTDRIKVVTSYVDNTFNDAWITEDEEGEYKYLQSNEHIEINVWSKLGNENI